MKIRHKKLQLMVLLTLILIASCMNSSNREAKVGNTGSGEFTVLFVCEHGAAKSIVAAAHFNRIAREQGLNMRAISRGTNPDAKIPPKIIQSLQAEGLVPGEAKPKLLLKDDFAGASRVVTFCDLPEGYDKLAPAENWSDVPPISENYDRSRDAMLTHINQLLAEIKAQK